MKITICGSMSVAREMLEVAERLEELGHEPFLPENTQEYASGNLEIVGEDRPSEAARRKMENDLIRKHFRKIEKSDAVLVVNPDKKGVKNYIGANSFLEMGYAHYLGKKIFVLHGLPDMPYINEELLAFGAIELNGNLELIK